MSNQEGEQGQRDKSYAQSFFALTKTLIVRGIIIYAISSFFRRPAQAPQTTVGGPAVAPHTATNIYSNGTLFDLHVYLSESEKFKDFNNTKAKVWTEYGLVYGDWSSGPDHDGSRFFHHKFVPPKTLLNNGSIYLHVYVTPKGKSPDPKSMLYGGEMVAHGKKRVNKFKKIKYQQTHNLLTGETKATEEEIKVMIFLCLNLINNYLNGLIIIKLPKSFSNKLISFSESKNNGSRNFIALASKFNIKFSCGSFYSGAGSTTSTAR